MNKEEYKFIASIPNKVNADGDIVLTQAEVSRLISLIHRLDKECGRSTGFIHDFQRDMDKFTKRYGKREA